MLAKRGLKGKESKKGISETTPADNLKNKFAGRDKNISSKNEKT